jgi:uncharacterized protein YgiM (DUF1202 family)
MRFVATSFVVGLLSLGTMMTGSLPVMARPATVTTDSNIRSGASLKSPVLEVLPSGGEVEVLNIVLTNRDYWYYVRPKVEGTAEGWVRSNLIRFKPSNLIYGTLAGDRDSKINVRSRPSLDGKILHYGLAGDLVIVGESQKVAGQRHSWYRVTFPNQASGWVREDLLAVWPKGCIITCPDN